MNTPTSWSCLRTDGKAPNQKVVIDISVSPNAKKTEIVGWHDGALRLRLAAPPVDGAANDALRKWLATQLGVPQSRVELLRGASGRRKQWSVDASMDDVTAWLSTQIALQK
ncbi:DUF167 domain-containing protein [Aquabacterium sp.]|uniref:DUF167 domain-containing protein n=1 Tax=Aquabacterium sp. TaxID=1872578 RepID=UPI0035AF41AE